MPKILEDCVRDLKAKGTSGNAWAICTASLKKAGKLREGTSRQKKHAEIRHFHRQCSCGCDACHLEISPTFRPSKKPAKFGEGSSSLHGVEIFASGVFRDKPYTEDDLDDMVNNFRRYSQGKKTVLRVPAVLGHEETQELLERSDLPAAAWATDLYRGKKECPTCMGSGLTQDAEHKCPMCSGRGDVNTLKADFDDVPPKVARLLKGKAYRQVSAEVYDEPPEGLGGSGKMLRRVAFPGWRDTTGQELGRHSGAGRAFGSSQAKGCFVVVQGSCPAQVRGVCSLLGGQNNGA